MFTISRAHAIKGEAHGAESVQDIKNEPFWMPELPAWRGVSETSDLKTIGQPKWKLENTDAVDETEPYLSEAVQGKAQVGLAEREEQARGFVRVLLKVTHREQSVQMKAKIPDRAAEVWYSRLRRSSGSLKTRSGNS